MKKFNEISFIKESIGNFSRQLQKEKEMAEKILTVLKQGAVDFELQKYKNYIPLEVKASLKADGKSIDCKSNGFASGEIQDKHNLCSSLSEYEASVPNINFNPECKGISLARFYQAPSLAISSLDVKKVLAAKKIEGYVEVKKEPHQSLNILVGNKKNPKNIYFTHFDSVNKGAIDNASGVAVLLGAIIENPSLLEHNLFAICGSEELSYDWPNYWGFGYRVFQKKYKKLMDSAKKITVVDGVGHSKTEKITDKHWMLEAFPIDNFEKYQRKISVFAGNIERLMPVYHSDLDGVHLLKKEFIQEAKKIVISESF